VLLVPKKNLRAVLRETGHQSNERKDQTIGEAELSNMPIRDRMKKVLPEVRLCSCRNLLKKDLHARGKISRSFKILDSENVRAKA